MTLLHRLLPGIVLTLLIAGFSVAAPPVAAPRATQGAGMAAVAVDAEGASPFPGVSVAQLDAGHWIARLDQPDAPLLDRAAIDVRNRRLLRDDPSLHDLSALPATLERTRVDGWLRARSARPSRTLYDDSGQQIAAATVDGWMDDIAGDAIPANQPTRFGLVVTRANLRTFPTAQRVFSAPGDTDIDRFQETALFPGTPVVIAHASRDGQWWLVVSDTYAAWVDKRSVAEGMRAEVLGYASKAPFLVVTGAGVRTTMTPSLPAVSELPLDMGVRVPRLAAWPALQAVNGQLPASSYVVELPVRAADGRLRLVPALVPRSADVAADHLPLTRANLLRQAFKYLGERYGWGHDYGARDCSGYMAEVYRSMGVLLPRNTGDQARSPVLVRRGFTPADTRAARDAELPALDVGDMVHVPGHVMLVIGHEGGVPFVIHDIQGTSLTTADGRTQRVTLNGVSVTPLTTLRASAAQSYVDRMTAVVRVRP